MVQFMFIMFPQNRSLSYYLPQGQNFFKILLKNGVITIEYRKKLNRVSLLTNPGSCLSSSGLPPAFNHTVRDGNRGIK
jgi:hypothetical protein